MDKLKDLREKRGVAITTARATSDKAIAEKRGMTAEEQKIYSAAMDEAESLRVTIEAGERQETLAKEQAQRDDAEARLRAGNAGGGPETPEQRAMKSFRGLIRGTIEREQYRTELRALQQDSDNSGGYLSVPLQFNKDFIAFVKDMVFIRAMATVYQVTNADSLGTPALATEAADSDWTNELGTGNEDTTLAFGLRELKPHPLAKRIKVSNKLLRVAAVDPESILRDRLGYKFGVTEEKGFLTGNGGNQPLGVFTASGYGIDTSRDVSTGNSTTAIGADGLIEALYGLKAQYQAAASWVFHRTGVKNIAKLKDGEGQYLWRPGLTAGTSDTLLGRPVKMSEYAPSTFTTGLYVGIVGDFSKYWIADALTMQVQRLNELYAEANEVGFIMRKETDGMPVLAEAFSRVKLA
jgi:HK97 family phage major capsid protein